MEESSLGFLEPEGFEEIVPDLHSSDSAMFVNCTADKKKTKLNKLSLFKIDVLAEKNTPDIIGSDSQRPLEFVLSGR